MSSWKKAGKSHQKVHRERHQPDKRSHLGILEKKKDYKERTKNYHRNENTIKVLKRRALDRNPDEFYFHMINSRMKDGEHHELEKEDEHTPQQISLMQTQDLKYVRTKHTMESNKVNTLQSQLHLLDVANKTENKHIFFVDSIKEARKFDVASHLDVPPSMLERRINRLRTSKLKELEMPTMSKSELKACAAHRKKCYEELRNRIERERELKIIEEKLIMKRHLQNKKEMKPTRIKSASKDAPPIYKWRYDRKK